MKNALRLMKRDHDVISELFAEVSRLLHEADATEGDIRIAFDDLKHELVAHLNSEEEAVYSVLRTEAETRVDAYESAAEHGVVLDLLEKMADTPLIDDVWKAEFHVLRMTVERHVANEELELFPRIAKIFSQTQLDKMGEDIIALRVLIDETVFAPKQFPIESVRSAYSRSPESRRGY